MFSDTLISPRADHAIRNRSAKFKKRTDIPDFRDILRQRCRERVKAKRGSIMDQLRSIDSEDSVRNVLTQFIESDLMELQSTCSLKEPKRLFESMDCEMNKKDEPLACLALTEREKWILTEYERLIDTANAQVEQASQVVCPMCSRGVLRANQLTNVVTCSLCSLLLPLRVPLYETERLIEQAINNHEQTCPDQPLFTVVPDGSVNNLLVICSTCSHASQVV